MRAIEMVPKAGNFGRNGNYYSPTILQFNQTKAIPYFFPTPYQVCSHLFPHFPKQVVAISLK
jgi:hypothetical protein